MPLPILLRFLHAAPAEGVSDADLLRRFAAVRDEAAFELLVRRHADLVWKVCRGVLRQEADAEDAFQATFLALARKAGSVRGGCVAGWLHRVALHAALKLRAKAARTAAAELPDLPTPVGPDPARAAVIHEELARLGDRYRLPVLLCDLEGHTYAEAAKVLGWPIGTVSGRLSRGRDRLRQRLERRGVAVGLVAISGNASGNLVRSAASAAGGGASPAVVSLAEGVLSAMRTAKLKLMAAVSAAAVGLAGTGAIVAVGQERKAGEGGKPDTTAKADAGKPDPAWNSGVPTAFPDLKPIDWKEIKTYVDRHADPVLNTDPPLRKLQKARLKALLTTLVLETQRFGNPDIALRLEPRLADLATLVQDTVAAALALYDRPEDRRSWLEFGVGVQKQLEWYFAERVKAGIAMPSSTSIAQRYRLDAEIALMKHAQQREGLAK